MQHSIGMRPETWTKENIRKGEMAAMKCPECGRESHTGTVCACCGAILPRYDPFRELGDIIPKENETADKQPEVYFAEKKQNVSTDVDCFTGLGDLVDDKTLLNDNEEKCNSEVDLYGKLAGRDAFNSLGDLDDETTDKIEVDFACENINYGHSSEDNDDRDVRRGSKMILRWKRWSLAAACLAVIVAVSVLLLRGKDDRVTGVSELEVVGVIIDEIELDYTDDTGTVADEDIEKLVNEVYSEVSNLSNVEYCEKNSFGVYMILNDGLGVHYNVPVEGLANSGDEITIYSYQPYFTEFVEGQEDLLKNGRYPDKAVENLCDLKYTKSSANALYNEDVTIEEVKKMRGNSVVLWIGHGGYSTKYHSTLCLSVIYDKTIYQKYKTDIEAHRIEVYISGNSYKVCLTPAFFEHYLAEGALENSIIYLGSCHSGEDDVLAETLIAKGADAVYCNTDSVFQQYNNRMCRSIMDYLCEGETTGQALNRARAKNGAYDNVIFGLVKSHAQVRCAGNSGMTLLDLQKQIAQGDVQQPIDTIGPNEVQLSDTCDYILSYGVDAEGNKYELVANQRESALGYEITVGIIKNNTWLYPMSTEFPFLDQEDNLFHVSVDGAGNSGYSLDMYSAIIDNIYFVDVGAFAMDSYHETNSWIETYDHTFIFFSCSTMESKVIDLKEYQLELVATKNDRQIYTDNGQILIWTEDVVDTGILSYDYFYDWCLLDAETLSITTIGSRIKDCSPSSILAEGLIFASDKCFYNTDMQKVIDLSQYNIDMYYDSGIYFKNGQCIFKAKNKLGHEYEITIDIHGNVLSEVPIG